MRLTALSLSVFLAFSAATVTVAPRAFAQATDADRAAARDLFNKGVELQNQQKFADALDRFERSQKVVNAPTNLLHIGQCQAALGHLVEAAEAFRAAARFQLAAGAPAPFVAAQNEANTQLSTIEPRIPELKITVSPKDIPTLTVTIDDQPVNSALVGVSRPVNPGSHKVSATAPGYTKAERQVDLKEKQKLEVALSLVSTGGVVYGPTGTENQNGTPPPAGSGSAAPAGSDQPPPPPPPKPPADTRSKMSIFLGPRLGLIVPAGHLPGTNASGDSQSMSDYAGPGASLGLEGSLRIARILFFSLFVDAAGFSSKQPFVASGTNGTTFTSSASSVIGGARIGILTNPEGFGFYGTLGAGYRYFHIGLDDNNGNTSDIGLQGIDYQLGLGMHFKAGKYVRLVPMTEITYGSLSTKDVSVTTNNTTSSESNLDSDGAGHFFFFLGMGGYFDIDLDKPKPEPAKSTTPASSSPSAPPSADSSGGVTITP